MAKTKTRSRRQQRLTDADANAMPISGDRDGREQTGSEVPGKGTVVSLPLHLLEDILWHLSALESARFAAVCKSLAGLASRRLADPAPHLFAFRSTAAHRRGEIIAVPLGGESDSSRHDHARATPAHRARQRVTRRTECLGATASGRLVLANTRRTVLFNPVTGTSRRIKKVPGVSYKSYTVNPMPVVPLGGDSFFHAAGSQVGIWRAEDDTWTVQDVDIRPAESLRMAALCGGSLYVMDNIGYVYQVQVPTLDTTEVAVRNLRYKYPTALAGAAIEKGYLVEAGGEVLFVWPLYTTSRVRGKRDEFDPEVFASDDDDDGEDDDYFFDDVTTLSGFDLYRLDLEEMQWVEEDRLPGDDVALFVSRRSSFSVRAASEEGCVSNCVYFVCDEGAGNTWGAFSLGERRMLFEHAIGAASYRERLWFYPSCSKDPGLEDLAVQPVDDALADHGPIRVTATRKTGGGDVVAWTSLGEHGSKIQSQRYACLDVYHPDGAGGEGGRSRGVIAGGAIAMIAGTRGVWITLVRAAQDVAELIRQAWRRGIRVDW